MNWEELQLKLSYCKHGELELLYWFLFTNARALYYRKSLVSLPWHKVLKSFFLHLETCQYMIFVVKGDSVNSCIQSAFYTTIIIVGCGHVSRAPILCLQQLFVHHTWLSRLKGIWLQDNYKDIMRQVLLTCLTSFTLFNNGRAFKFRQGRIAPPNVAKGHVILYTAKCTKIIVWAPGIVV